MSIDSNALLRTLGSNISGAITGAGHTSSAKTSGGLDFAKLLASARAGDIHSGIKVTSARDANVSLSDGQLQRLSAAADLAEANGISRGLFMIDGKNVVMDVGNRTIIGEVSAEQAGVVAGVDGVINVPTAADSASANVGTSTSGLSTISNASLLQALNEHGTQAA